MAQMDSKHLEVAYISITASVCGLGRKFSRLEVKQSNPIGGIKKKEGFAGLPSKML